MMRKLLAALFAFATMTACIADGGEEAAIDDDLPLDQDDPAQTDEREAEGTYAKADPAALRPGCTATGSLGGHTAWFHFTRPDAPCAGNKGSGVDHHIVDELIRLIKSVPKGGRIDGHIFSITVTGVARALLEAQNDGVEVYLSTNGAVGDMTAPIKTDYLDKLKHRVYCGNKNTNSCIGGGEASISHTKLFTFSEAKTPDGKTSKNVVWFGSANQTIHSGKKLYNNTVTVYGDGTLYTKLSRYLDDLYEQRRTHDYYDSSSGRGHLLAAAADVYVSPDADTDLIINRLNDVTPNDRCRVDVMQNSLRDSRINVVELLVKMKTGKCDVRVASSNIGERAGAMLRAAGIPVHQRKVHDKAFIIYGKYGNNYEYRVYTGSHNLSISANRKYDEIFVKLAAEGEASHPVYDAYRRHFADAY